MQNTNHPTYRILHTEWSSGWGGQEQRIILESLKMMALGHTVMIAGQPDSGILRKAREHGIPTEEVVIRGTADLLALLHLVRLIKRDSFSIVNTHSGKDTWVGGIAARLCGALFIRTRHLMIPISTSPLNFINRMADGIVTTGESVRRAMITDNRIQPERIISIPTGVSLEHFTSGIDTRKIRHELGIATDAPVISMVAILRGAKRHDIFLKMAAILKKQFPTARYLIVGDGPARPSIEQGIRELGLANDVVLTGHRNDVPEIMALSDVVVLTSDKEGVPQTLTQAMAMQKPVVAAPVGGIPDLIEDNKTGLFAEAGNAESFAAQVTLLLSDPQMRSSIGRGGSTFVLQNFTADIMVEKTLRFYDHLSDLRAHKFNGPKTVPEKHNCRD